jgi:hypothetical protein
MGVHAFSTMRLLGPAVDADMRNLFGYIAENTAKNSCVMTIPDWGGMIQYYAKRPSYVSSTNQNLPKFEKFSEFLLTNQTFSLDVNDSYVVLMPDDFKKIDGIISVSDISGLYVEKLILDGKTRDASQKNEYISSDNRKYTAEISDNRIKVRRVDGNTSIRTIYLEEGGTVHTFKDASAQDDGCIYLSDYVTIYGNAQLCDTNIMKMLTQQNIKGLELTYSHNNGRVYKATGPVEQMALNIFHA